MSRDDVDADRLCFIGIPGAFHGTTLPGQDVEIQLVKSFPQCGLFIEKPISGNPDTEEPKKLNNFFEENGTVVSVGYMLRYVRAVQEMKYEKFIF